MRARWDPGSKIMSQEDFPPCRQNPPGLGGPRTCLPGRPGKRRTGLAGGAARSRAPSGTAFSPANVPSQSLVHDKSALEREQSACRRGERGSRQESEPGRSGEPFRLKPAWGRGEERRTLISGEPDGFNFWEIESHEGDKWRIEELPGARRRDFPRHPVPKYFVTSQGPCTKHQLISFKKEGYWEELMDETKPDIVVKDWFHCGCPCRYQLRVKLLSADFSVLQEFRPKDVIVEQCSDREWREVSHTFHNYPAGVRHVLFKHGGQGWYGMRITNSSVTVGPETRE